jgi:hypothetical protein
VLAERHLENPAVEVLVFLQRDVLAFELLFQASERDLDVLALLRFNVYRG